MKLLRFLMLLSLSLVLAACGGGGDDEDRSGYGPSANAGADQTVAMGDTVTLDGSASTTGSSGGSLSYSWTLTNKPVGSDASLSDAKIAKPVFVADLPGSYVAELVVNDGTSGSTADSVTVSATSELPVAIATRTQSVLIGTTVTLDGSNSVPPTGGTVAGLSYQWTLTSRPSASSAVISAATAASTTFFADVAGTYTATLVVTHGELISDPLTITIEAKVGNTVPVAVAKVGSIGGVAATPSNSAATYQYSVERGQVVTLDGTGSTDSDGDTLNYRWYFFAPTSSASTASAIVPTATQLSRATVLTGATPSFTPDAAGTWYVYLYVHDGSSLSTLSASTWVRLNVVKPADAANTPPVAVFQTVGDTYELELGKTASRSGNSYDIDNDTLVRSFRWVSTPAGFVQPDLSSTTYLSFTPSVEGDYSVELTVSDGTASTSTQGTFTALTGANVRPAAYVSVDSSTVMVGTTAWFDGSNSSDSNGDALSYQWTLLDKPDGSNAVLQNSTSVRASIVPDVAGVYLARLMVTDSWNATSSVTTVAYGKVQAKSKNNAPTVDDLYAAYSGSFVIKYRGDNLKLSGTAEQPFLKGVSMFFSPTSAVDPDNDTLYYLWTLDRPTGSTVADAGTSSTLSITPDVAGTYTATFVVSDGVATSEPQSISVEVVDVDNYPSLLMKSYGTFSSLNYSVPVAWPYVLNDRSYSSISSASSFPVYYSLTAYGGDYTITGLTTSSAITGDSAPSFSGLVNGQVIKQGETVTFTLQDPLYSSTSTKDAYDISWSFSILEKPEYTFKVRRYIQAL